MIDNMNEDIALYIERQTDTVTRVHFDAGFHECSGFARRNARQMAHEREDANTFVLNRALVASRF